MFNGLHYINPRQRPVVTSFLLSIILFSLLPTLVSAAEVAKPLSKHPIFYSSKLDMVSPMLPKKKTAPLHQPINAPQKQNSYYKKPLEAAPGALVSTTRAQVVKKMNGTQSHTSATKAAEAIACSSPTISMKVLVVASDGNEVDLPGITQELNYLGIPYTVYIAAQTPGGLTPDMLSSGCNGYYQGVILTNGELTYDNNGTWMSALSQAEWSNLWTYEASMGIRQLSWYTYPTADFGYQVPTAAVDTTSSPLATTLTTQGQSIFQYLQPGVTVTIQDAYTYLSQPLTDGATTPVLTDANGNTLAAIRTTSDGRQTLSLTFDSNQYLLHNMLLANGLVNWVTNGLFLGERHVYMSPQVDDIFIDGAEWVPSTPCGTPVDQTGSTYRTTGADWNAIINWQTSKQSDPLTANLALTTAFNGYGTTPDAGYSPDTLTPAAIATQQDTNWVSHTYDHTNLDNVDYATAASEITQNNAVAQNTLNLTNYSIDSMVTPDVSGLTNPNFLQAAYDNGIRYLVTDTSVAGYNNPSPNAGIYNSYQPSILMLPRHPTNLYYNVSQPDEWAAEYNCMYASYWGRNLSYQEILDVESQRLLTYMIQGDMDPWMFHSENLRAYDGTHTLLTDLLDETLQKYEQYYNLPVQFNQMSQLGQKIANRMQYNAAGVTASVVPGVSITLTAQQATTVPVTGLKTANAESYGGQSISYVTLSAGQTVTLPLA
jgi:hypothetical protein